MHFIISYNEIWMIIRNAPVYHVFYKRAIAAINTSAYYPQFCTPREKFPHIPLGITDNTLARRFHPTSKAANTRADRLLF